MNNNSTTVLTIMLYTALAGLVIGFAVNNPTPTQIGLSSWCVIQNIVFCARRLIQEAQINAR